MYLCITIFLVLMMFEVSIQAQTTHLTSWAARNQTWACVALKHRPPPAMCKEVLISPRMLWNILTILSAEHYTLGQNLLSPQTSQIRRYMSLTICKMEYHRALWKCLSWETFQLPESYSSPWKASGPNSQAPAVRPWHRDMIQKHLLWDSRINLAHFRELGSFSYTLKTFPNF